MTNNYTSTEEFQLLRKKKGVAFYVCFLVSINIKVNMVNGKCQRDFICKNQWHEKHPIKKYIGVP